MYGIAAVPSLLNAFETRTHMLRCQLAAGPVPEIQTPLVDLLPRLLTTRVQTLRSKIPALRSLGAEQRSEWFRDDCDGLSELHKLRFSTSPAPAPQKAITQMQAAKHWAICWPSFCCGQFASYALNKASFGRLFHLWFIPAG